MYSFCMFVLQIFWSSRLKKILSRCTTCRFWKRRLPQHCNTLQSSPLSKSWPHVGRCDQNARCRGEVPKYDNSTWIPIVFFKWLIFWNYDFRYGILEFTEQLCWGPMQQWHGGKVKHRQDRGNADMSLRVLLQWQLRASAPDLSGAWLQ